MDRELRATAMPGPRDVALRESAPPQQPPPPPQHAAPPQRPPPDEHRSHAHSRPGHDSHQHPRPPSDVWAGAISRLQTQVSYNTSMHESHRRQVHDIEQAVGRLQQEMNNVVTVISELRTEIRSKPASADAIKSDPGDLELLATQVAQITTKANEVDGLKLQIELMKNRMRRFEEHGGHTPNPVHAAPPPPSSHPMHGSPAASSLRPGPSPGSHPHEPTSHPPPPPPQHQPHHPGHALPPMRTASMASPRDDRPPNYPGPPPLNPQTSGGYRPPGDQRPHSNEPGPPPMAPANFRPADPLPPPSSLSGWRSADSFTSPAGSHAPLPHQQHGPGQPHGGDPDNHSRGWAAVNQPPKRPFEDQRPPYEASPGSGSPKRPKLAPIMPRGHYEEGQHGPPANFAQSSMTPDTFRPRSRAPSDDMQGTPVGGGSQNSFRFVTATAPAPSSAPSEGHHEMWRPETDHPPGRGRGRGRGGRGRGRGSRGGRGGGPTIIQAEPPQQEAPRPPPEPMPAVQMSPNGYYNAMHQQPQSPRSEIMRRPPPGPMEGEHSAGGIPGTPIVHAGHDQFAVQDPHSGSGKKSRTKPIRNAEGVLIRKDGRPDMRSVSSANNLRKVHAKKEAERADYDGRTPTSSRSFMNADSNSEHGGTRSATPMSGAAGEYHDEDDIDGPNGTGEHDHEETRQYSHEHGHGPSLADRFFPRHEPQQAQNADVDMKSESAEEGKRSASAKSEEENKAAQGQGEAETDSGDNITAVGPPPRASEKPDVVMQGSDESAKETAADEKPSDGKAEVNGSDSATIEVASKSRDAVADEQKTEPAVAAA